MKFLDRIPLRSSLKPLALACAVALGLGAGTSHATQFDIVGSNGWVDSWGDGTPDYATDVFAGGASALSGNAALVYDHDGADPGRGVDHLFDTPLTGTVEIKFNVYIPGTNQGAFFLAYYMKDAAAADVSSWGGAYLQPASCWIEEWGGIDGPILTRDVWQEVKMVLDFTAGTAQYFKNGVAVGDPTAITGTSLSGFGLPYKESHMGTSFTGPVYLDDFSVTHNSTVIWTENFDSYIAPASNDNFVNATTLAGDSGTNTGASTVGATFEAGEPVCKYADATNTVWYKWVCTTAGFLTVSTEGSLSTGSGPWDAVLGVYTGTTLGTLTKLIAQDTDYAETATLEVVPGTYYIQVCGCPPLPNDTADLNLTWSLAVQTDTVVDISNAIGPLVEGGITINNVVGLGNIGRLTGETQTFWNSRGFAVPVQLNGNKLIINTGGGNPFVISGAISGNGVVQVDAGGADNLYIRGAVGNTYTGTTVLNSGPIVLGKSAGNALCGSITVNGVKSEDSRLPFPSTGNLVWTASNQISDTSAVTLVTSGAILDLAGFSDTLGDLTLATGTSVATGTAGVLTVNSLTVDVTAMAAGDYTSTSAFVTGGGKVTVLNGPGAPPVSIALSTVTAAPGSVPADGATTSTVTVTLLDGSSAPVAGKTVTLASSRSGTDTIAAASGVSDASGVVTFAVKSSTAGSPVFTATDTTDGVTITATASVTFTAVVSYVDVSNATTPWEPTNTAAGVRIDVLVTAGNSARLIGTTQTHWGSGGFSRAVNLNENILIIDSGGGNRMNISGTISGNGTVRLQGPAIRLQGSTGNTYTGTTVNVQGATSLEKTSGNALCGSISLTGGSLVWTVGNQLDDASDVTLASATSLNLAGYNDTIKDLYLVTGSYVQTGALGILKVARLFINGTQQPETAYVAGDNYVLGSGYIEVGASGPPVIANPPSTPITPVPADLATVHPVNGPKLNWDDCTLAASYDVYLWRSTETKPLTPTATVGLSEYPVSPQVNSLTTYKWQVVAKNSAGESPSAEWTFTTLSRQDISDVLTPGPQGPTQGIVLDTTVGIGYTGRLVGPTSTFWGSGGFTVALNLNGNTLYLATGGNNHNENGPISGDGVVVLKDGGSLKVGGTIGNTYTGITTVNCSATLSKSAGDALCGTITLNNGATLIWANSNQIGDTSPVTLVLAASKLNLAGYSDTIGGLTLATGATVDTGTGGVLTVSSLTVGGVVMPSGTYLASEINTFITGTGSVIVPSLGTVTTTLVSGTGTSTIGTSVTLTATVSPAPTGGTVQFHDNGTDIGSPASVDSGTGIATAATTALTVGSHTITATYSGDSGSLTSADLTGATQTVVTQFGGWALAKGLTPGVNDGPNDDPDADAVPNFIEFAFNGNPKSAADNGMIYATTETSTQYGGNKVLVLTIAVRPGTPAVWTDNSATIDGITYTIEGGVSLGDFSSDASKVSAADSNAYGAGPPTGGYEWRRFILSASEGLGGKGFLRAKVVQD